MGTGRVPDEKRGHEFGIAENGALPARRFSRSPLYFGIYLHFSITKKKKKVSSKCSVGGPSSTNVHSGRRRRARKRAEGAPAEIEPSGRGPQGGSRIAAPATCAPGLMRPATSHPPRGAPLAFQRLRPVARLESQSCCVNETLELSNSPP